MDSAFAVAARGVVLEPEPVAPAVAQPHPAVARSGWRLGWAWWAAVRRWTVSDLIDTYPVVVISTTLLFVLTAAVAAATGVDLLRLGILWKVAGFVVIVIGCHAVFIAGGVANLLVPFTPTTFGPEQDSDAWKTMFCYAMLPYLVALLAIGLWRFRSDAHIGVLYLLTAAIAFSECNSVFVATVVCHGVLG